MVLKSVLQRGGKGGRGQREEVIGCGSGRELGLGRARNCEVHMLHNIIMWTQVSKSDNFCSNLSLITSLAAWLNSSQSQWKNLGHFPGNKPPQVVSAYARATL